jgi:hypothetical protein
MKKSQKQTAGILVFLKDQCANWDEHYQICLLNDKSCKVKEGSRCGYFEKNVLGPADYPYRLPGYDYVKLFAEYVDQTGAETRKVRQRRCECGSPLQHRQRFCERCRRLKAKMANRERQRKHRSPNSLNITV